MCWFADWVTLLSARCKYKITATCFDLTSHLQTYLRTITNYNMPVHIWDPRWLTITLKFAPSQCTNIFDTKRNSFAQSAKFLLYTPNVILPVSPPTIFPIWFRTRIIGNSMFKKDGWARAGFGYRNMWSALVNVAMKIWLLIFLISLPRRPLLQGIIQFISLRSNDLEQEVLMSDMKNILTHSTWSVKEGPPPQKKISFYKSFNFTHLQMTNTGQTMYGAWRIRNKCDWFERFLSTDLWSYIYIYIYIYTYRVIL